MGFFDFFNKKSTSTSVVWRDEKGVIRCLGDSCAQKKCDDTCPIWLKTLAQQMFQMQEYDKSIENFRQALLIAPDFGECWNNLAAVYGTVNNHIEANKAYMTA